MPSECRIWTKQRYRKYGYGLVHRVVYEYVFGEIPEGYEVHHTCNNSLCFNPEHLQAISQEAHFALRKKTHCKRGHALTPNNVYRSKGKRSCKLCKLSYCSAYQKKHPEKYAEYQRKYLKRKAAA